MPGIMTPDYDRIVTHLKNDHAELLNWTLALDCYILKIFPVKSTPLIWVIGGEEKVFLVNAAKSTVVQTFDSLGDIIFAAVLNANTGNVLVASSTGVYQLSQSGEKTILLKEESWFEHIALSTDGLILFIACGKTLYIFLKKKNNYQLFSKDDSFTSTISDILFNHDAFLVSNYGGIREYSSRKLNRYTLHGWKTSLLSTSWSPDKKYITASTQENAIHFWPYPFHEQKDFQISGYHSKVNKMIWSRDSSLFVVNNAEDVHIWDFSEGPPTGKSPTLLRCSFGKITDICYKQNLLIAASEKGFIFYFVPDTSNRFIHIHAVDDEITCIDLNDDETELFVGCKSGKVHAIEVVI